MLVSERVKAVYICHILKGGSVAGVHSGAGDGGHRPPLFSIEGTRFSTVLLESMKKECSQFHQLPC